MTLDLDHVRELRLNGALVESLYIEGRLMWSSNRVYAPGGGRIEIIGLQAAQSVPGMAGLIVMEFRLQGGNVQAQAADGMGAALHGQSRMSGRQKAAPVRGRNGRSGGKTKIAVRLAGGAFAMALGKTVPRVQVNARQAAQAGRGANGQSLARIKLAVQSAADAGAGAAGGAYLQLQLKTQSTADAAPGWGFAPTGTAGVRQSTFAIPGSAVNGGGSGQMQQMENRIKAVCAAAKMAGAAGETLVGGTAYLQKAVAQEAAIQGRPAARIWGVGRAERAADGKPAAGVMLSVNAAADSTAGADGTAGGLPWMKGGMTARAEPEEVPADWVLPEVQGGWLIVRQVREIGSENGYIQLR